MTPHPRYNSRVLSFLARRFDAFRDRTQEFVRHTKMVGRWTAEVALYPFSRWIQTQKLIGQKVQQAVEAFTKKLKTATDRQVTLKAAPDKSAPILRILEAIEIVQDSYHSDGLITPNSNRVTVTIRPKNGFLPWIKNRVIAFEKHRRGWMQPVLPQTIETTPSQSTSIACIAPPQKGFLAWLKRGVSALQKVQPGWIQPVSAQPFETALDFDPNHQWVNCPPQKGLWAWVKNKIPVLGKVQRILSLPFGTHTLDFCSGLTHSAQLVNSWDRSITIQGVASLLCSRTLVLVTPKQEILDILSPEQQAHLHQRMIQELARVHWQDQPSQLMGKVIQFFLGFNLKGATQPLRQLAEKRQAIALQPSHPLFKLKKWVIHSVIGALAVLPIVSIPALAEPSHPRPQSASAQNLSALWIDPNHFKTPVSLEELYGMVSGQVQGQKGLRTYPKGTEKTTIESTYSQPLNRKPLLEANNSTEIWVEAEFIGYDPHLLERILMLLDILMVQLESVLAMAWTWIGILFLLCLTGVQKLRQLISD